MTKLKHFECYLYDKWMAWQDDENTKIVKNKTKVVIDMIRSINDKPMKMKMVINLTPLTAYVEG